MDSWGKAGVAAGTRGGCVLVEANPGCSWRKRPMSLSHPADSVGPGGEKVDCSEGLTEPVAWQCSTCVDVL